MLFYSVFYLYPSPLGYIFDCETQSLPHNLGKAGLLLLLLFFMFYGGKR